MVTIAIVTRGVTPAVERLVADLLAAPSPPDGREVLVVAEDPSVVGPASRETMGDGGAFLVRIPRGRGLGYNRNRAVEAAAGDVVVFMDDDCVPGPEWLDRLLEPLADPGVDAVMGGVRIPPSTFIGDSISALGFPAGGSVGFGVMFGVDADGFTDHLSTLNCALRRDVFARVGRFDESMTCGGEDGELSHRIAAAGLHVKFQPEALVEHEARTRLTEFARWFFRRGRAACQYARRAPASGRVGRRLASYRHILRVHRTDPRLVAIVPLLVASVLLQQAGFGFELLREAAHKG